VLTSLLGETSNFLPPECGRVRLSPPPAVHWLTRVQGSRLSRRPVRTAECRHLSSGPLGTPPREELKVHGWSRGLNSRSCSRGRSNSECPFARPNPGTSRFTTLPERTLQQDAHVSCCDCTPARSTGAEEQCAACRVQTRRQDPAASFQASTGPPG